MAWQLPAQFGKPTKMPSQDDLSSELDFGATLRGFSAGQRLFDRYKLKEILGDPDDGFDLNANIRERLLQQQQAVAEGERGDDLNEIVGRLGLT